MELKSITQKEDDLLRKFKIKSKAKDEYKRQYYINKINILSKKLHMSDEDIKKYFHKGIMLKGQINYDCDIRKKLFEKYKLIGEHYESHDRDYYGEDFGWEENHYYLYENDKHLILHHSCYMTGDGTDHWITLIR